MIYDLANTIFALGVTGLYFPEWMTRVGLGDTWLAATQSTAAVIVVMAAPWLGARSDHRRRRMPALVATTLVAVGATATLTSGPRLVTFLMLGVALVAVNTGSVVYDALLAVVSTPATRGRISGLGVGVGYLGSFVGLGLGYLTLDALGWGYRATFLSLAAGFLLFSIPTFAWVREPALPPKPGRPPAATMMARDLIRSWGDTRHYHGLTRFLVGRFLYTDAINTLIGGFLTVYAITELGLDRSGSQALLGSAIVGAIVGGLGGGRVAEHFGSIRVLRWALAVWVVVIGGAIVAAVGDIRWIIPLIGPAGGMALGATWATDRVVMVRITPPERLGEFYGLYATVGRFATIVGPFVWWVTVDKLHLGRRVVMGTLAAFITAGWFVVGGVDDSERSWPVDG